MRSRMQPLLGIVALVFSTLTPSVFAQQADIPRTPDGRPDLSGIYDTATLTPLQRPARYGNRLSLTDEEAAAITAGEPAALARSFGIPTDRNKVTAPPREAPPVGGDGSTGAAGNVGGYNTFWMDRDNAAFQIDGEWRTSIITSPENGRRPPMTPEARQRFAAAFAPFLRPNTGTAWWVLDNGPDAPGPYDDSELRPLSERCLLGFGSTSGPPMLPVLYNNLKRIVQTDDHVMILVEMVHDARIVRMNQEHVPPRSGAGLVILSVTGKATRSWSTRRTSPTRRDSVGRRATCMSSSALRGLMPERSAISSRSTTRRCGHSRGAASTSGPRPTRASTSTPVTRPTTRSGASSVAHASWKPRPPGRDSRSVKR